MLKKGPKPDYEFKDLELCLDNGGIITKYTKCLVIKNGLPTGDSFYLDNLGEEVTLTEKEIANLKPCADENCFPVTKWIFDSAVLGNGVTEKFWQRDRADVGFAVGNIAQQPAQTIPEVFTEVDDCGVYVHENDADAIINVLPQWIPTDPTNSGSANYVIHQNCLDGWVCVDSADITLGARVNGFSSYAVFFGSCNGKLKLVEEGVNTTFAGANSYYVNLGSVGKGFFHARTYSSDPHQFGKTNLVWSLDGGNTWQDIPEQNLIPVRPSASCETLLLDKSTGKYFFEDGTPLPETTKCFSCDPCDVPTGLTPSAEQDVRVVKTTYNNLGNETVKFDDGTEAVLTVPAGATYATVEVQGCDIIYNSSGTKPVLGEDKTASECQELQVGCSPHFIGAIGDLANFRALASKAGCTGLLQVCYYGEV